MLRSACWPAALALIATPLPTHAQSALFDAPALDDAALAGQRAGFELPGGLIATLKVQITTDVNGERLLQTLWQIGPAGSYAVAQTPGRSVVTGDPRDALFRAELPGLQIEHFVGRRIGTFAANSADGRIIDQQMSVDLTLSNVQPLSIGSALPRIQFPGLDAALLRATGG